MARHSISVKGLTYQRLVDYTDSLGKSASGQLEEWIHDDLDQKGAPPCGLDEYEERRKKRKAEREAQKREKARVYKEDIQPQYMTFGAPGCQSDLGDRPSVSDQRAVSR